MPTSDPTNFAPWQLSQSFTGRITIHGYSISTHLDSISLHTCPLILALRKDYIWTRCSAIAERPRCRVRYSFRQK